MSADFRTVRLWVTEASTGIPLVFGSLAVAISVALTVAFPRESTGWSDALNAASILVLYTGPLALVGSALHSSSIGRRGTYALAATTARGRFAPARMAAATSLGWAVLAWGIQTVLMCLLQQPAGDLTPAPLVLALLGLSLTIAASVLGTALGAYRHQPLVAPAGGLAALAVLFVLTYLNSTYPTLSPIYTGTWFALNEQPNVRLMVGQSALCLSLACVGAALLANAVSSRISWVVAAALVVVVGIPLARSGGPNPVEYVRLSEPSCANSTVELCLWPQYSDRLGPQLQLFDEVTAEVRPFMSVPNSYAQQGLTVTGATAMSLSSPEDPADSLDRVVRAVVSGCPQAQVDARDSLRYWALARLRSDADSESSGHLEARIAAAPIAEQRTWVAGQVRLRGC